MASAKLVPRIFAENLGNNMATMETTTEVFPSVETLTHFETAVPCTVPGCTRILPSTSALRMHVVKTHDLAKGLEEKQLFVRGAVKSAGTKHFYCPAQFCPRGKDSERPFPRLGQLKQHYMTVHAEKKHICTKCDRGFGLPDACRRHEVKCGEVFTCSCGCPYTTREALLTHAKRHQHLVPQKKACNVSQDTKARVSPLSSTNGSIMEKNGNTNGKVGPEATIQTHKTLQHEKIQPRFCRILPKPNLSYRYMSTAKTSLDSRCQTGYTNQTCATKPYGEFRKYFPMTKDAQTQTNSGVNSVGSQTGRDVTARNDSKPTAQNTFTQTTQPTHSWNFDVPNTQHSSIGTQVALLADQCDFSVNTDEAFPCLQSSCSQRMFQLSESFTQTPDLSEMFACTFAPQGQCSQNFVQASMETNAALQNLGNEQMCLDTQTQTGLTHSDMGTIPDLRGLSSIQTQTQGIYPISLEDNETQTLTSVLGLDAANLTESGTQTQWLIDDIFGDGPDIEFADTQTQTWLVDLVGDSGMEASDFVEDLVNMHTQTVLAMADYSEFVDDTTSVNSQTQTGRGEHNGSYLLSSGCQTDDTPLRPVYRAPENGCSTTSINMYTQTHGQ